MHARDMAEKAAAFFGLDADECRVLEDVLSDDSCWLLGTHQEDIRMLRIPSGSPSLRGLIARIPAGAKLPPVDLGGPSVALLLAGTLREGVRIYRAGELVPRQDRRVAATTAGDDEDCVIAAKIERALPVNVDDSAPAAGG